jgi:hypothetical protein
MSKDCREHTHSGFYVQRIHQREETSLSTGHVYKKKQVLDTCRKNKVCNTYCWVVTHAEVMMCLSSHSNIAVAPKKRSSQNQILQNPKYPEKTDLGIFLTCTSFEIFLLQIFKKFHT